MTDLNHPPHGSYLYCLKDAWLATLTGCIMFSSGMWILLWNEGQAVQRARLLDEAIESVVVLPSSSALDKQNDGRLVHVSGILQVGEPLTEMEYGIAMSAIKLKRRVQMYQWEEEQTNSGQQDETKESFYTNYYYTTNWKDKLISSSKFYVQTGHHNPREFPLMSTVYISEDASVGRFSLSHALKNKFNDFTLFTGDERPERRDIKLHSGLYYHCQDVWNPEVGDIRVQFSYAGKTGEMVSLLAQQTGSVLQPYLTPTGMSVAVVHQGTHTVQQMFQEEHTRNWLSGWPLRGAGWMLIFIGGKCATTIINHFGSRHSFLYNILILHFGSTNFAVSLSMSILVIAFPWVWYRPYLGFCLLAVAILPFFYTSITFRHKKVQENMYHKM